MKKMLLILIYAIGIYALLVLFLFFFQRSYLYFPSKEKIDVSYFIDSGLKEIELTTSDGLVLKSWFKKPSTQNGYTILIFHGNAAHAALNFLSKQYIFSDKIILYGESLGCGIAAKLSSENAFAATILEAPYTSIADVAQRHYWYLPAKWLVLDRYDILRIIVKIKSPLLVIHGEKDNIINISLGKKVFDAAPQPKEALFVPNAGHNNLFEFNVEEKLLNFLEKQKKPYL